MGYISRLVCFVSYVTPIYCVFSLFIDWDFFQNRWFTDVGTSLQCFWNVWMIRKKKKKKNFIGERHMRVVCFKTLQVLRPTAMDWKSCYLNNVVQTHLFSSNTCSGFLPKRIFSNPSSSSDPVKSWPQICWCRTAIWLCNKVKSAQKKEILKRAD